MKKSLLRDTRGAYVEYIALVGVVALAVAGWIVFRNSVNAKLARQGECVQTLDCGGGNGGAEGASTGGGASEDGGGSFWGDAARAFGRKALSTATDLAMMTNPIGQVIMVKRQIEAGKHLVTAVQNPGLVWQAIKDDWNSQTSGEKVGSILFEAATLPLAPAKATKPLQAMRIVESVGVKAEQLAGRAARSAAETAETAAGGAAKKAEQAAGRLADARNPACPGGTCGVPGKNCFAAGTPVVTPSGEKAIETIETGELVMARDPITGITAERRVVQLFVTKDSAVLDLGLEANGAVEHLTVTPEHPFWRTTNGWTGASALDLGDVVATVSGEAHVVSMQSLRDRVTVYNFEVDEAHTYFVGSTGAFVHNTCDPPGMNIGGVDRKSEVGRINDKAAAGGNKGAEPPLSAHTGAGGLPETGGVLQKGEIVNQRTYERVADALNGKVKLAESRASLETVENYVDALRNGQSIPKVQMAPSTKGSPPTIVKGYESYVAGQLAGKPVEIEIVAAPSGTLRNTASIGVDF